MQLVTPTHTLTHTHTHTIRSLWLYTIERIDIKGIYQYKELSHVIRIFFQTFLDKVAPYAKYSQMHLSYQCSYSPAIDQFEIEYYIL